MTKNLDNLIKFNKLAEFINVTALYAKDDDFDLLNIVLSKTNKKIENNLRDYSLEKYRERANREDYFDLFNAYMRLQKYLFDKYCMGVLSYSDYQEKTKRLFYLFHLKSNLQFKYMLDL